MRELNLYQNIPHTNLCKNVLYGLTINSTLLVTDLQWENELQLKSKSDIQVSTMFSWVDSFFSIARCSCWSMQELDLHACTSSCSCESASQVSLHYAINPLDLHAEGTVIYDNVPCHFTIFPMLLIAKGDDSLAAILH
jgi:hypothetical protein